MSNFQSIEKPESYLPIAEAKEIFGEKFIGPEEFENCLGIKIDHKNISSLKSILEKPVTNHQQYLIYLPENDITNQTINLEYILKKYHPQQRRQLFNDETLDYIKTKYFVDRNNQSLMKEKSRKGWFLVPDKFIHSNSPLSSHYLEHTFRIALEVSHHVDHHQSHFQSAINQLREKYYQISDSMLADETAILLANLEINQLYRPNMTESILITSLIWEKNQCRHESKGEIQTALEKEKSIWTGTLDAQNEFIVLVPYPNYCQFGLTSTAPFYSDEDELGTICLYHV